eukprot:scaffold5800_cov189-Pinguiococcus_pyrenoidosus.AAC.4
MGAKDKAAERVRKKMSGFGRRSHYRKGVTAEVLYSCPEPDVANGERIAQIHSSRGGNVFGVIVFEPNAASPGDETLALLPTRFHKLIWVKRGDFLIVEKAAGAEEADADAGVGLRIKHVLYADQIKHLKEKGFWPSLLEAAAGEADRTAEGAAGEEAAAADRDEEDLMDMPRNTNRDAMNRARLQNQDSDDEDSEEEESDEEENQNGD